MSTGGEGGGVPDEGELRRVARPATVRRAPKFGAFIGAGVLVGVVLGLVLALLTRGNGPDNGTAFISFLGGDGTVRLESVLAFGVLGCLVGAAFAIGADRRSTRRR
jgi:hypothetical protein